MRLLCLHLIVLLLLGQHDRDCEDGEDGDDGEDEEDGEDGEDEEEYDYQDPDPEKLRNKTFGGNRLIGARVGKMRTEVPFIVLINNGEEFSFYCQSVSYSFGKVGSFQGKLRYF